MSALSLSFSLTNVLKYYESPYRGIYVLLRQNMRCCFNLNNVFVTYSLSSELANNQTVEIRSTYIQNSAKPAPFNRFLFVNEYFFER